MGPRTCDTTGPSNENNEDAVATTDATVACMYEPPAALTIPTHTKLVVLLQLEVLHATLTRAVLAV